MKLSKRAHSIVKLEFGAPSQGLKYLLSGSASANFVGRVGDPNNSKCNVNSNMGGIASLNMHLQPLNQDSKALEDVLDGGVSMHKAGGFDLMAISAK